MPCGIRYILAFSLAILAVVLVTTASADDKAAPSRWTQLIGGESLDAWRKVDDRLVRASDAKLDPDDERKLKATPGEGMLVAETRAGISDLVTNEKFGDCVLHAEFMVSKGSNSGIKLHAHYEIQIYDSYGRDQKHGSECGGVYPRWDYVKGRFTYLDEGIPPKVNASLPPGEWQTLDIVFRAPRFDEDGKKTQNARLVSAKLNGRTVHDNIELETPTGKINSSKEVPSGPVLIQVNHGPVAYRNVRVRSQDSDK